MVVVKKLLVLHFAKRTSYIGAKMLWEQYKDGCQEALVPIGPHVEWFSATNGCRSDTCMTWWTMKV